MERKERLLRIASSVAPHGEAALKYAAHLEELFDLIESEKIGADFAEAVARNDYELAVGICVRYYREKKDSGVSELSGVGDYDLRDAERYLKGTARVINIDWAFPTGEVDFLFDPTEIIGPRNHEWLWQFNRHAHWANLARTYSALGDEKYAAAFEKEVLRWIWQTDIPEKWNGPGSAWRTIECGLRLLGNWQIAFDAFRKSPSIHDVSLLLVIASMHRQAVHLALHPTKKNWLMMEANGLYTFSALFPELSDSAAHRKLATEHLLRELEKQILPDGMHDELSPDYQGVVFSCAANFYQLSLALGTASEIPEAFVSLMKRTVEAAILLSTPSFTQPRTNDTYTIKTSLFTARAEELLGTAPEYRFVNSERAEGAPPVSKTASAFLPYAGFAVMRSDWSAEAAYLCFDVGPLGMNHEHQDKLNINLYKGSQELIYDDGGGQYEISPIRKYAMSAYGHNTVLVDGMGQNRRGPLRAETPVEADWITNDDLDYAAAVYDGEFGEERVKPAVHKREVRFCKPDVFFIKDTLSSADGKAHDYEILFHLDTLHVQGIPEYQNAVISDFGKEYEVAIIPLDGAEREVSLHTVSAVTEPMPQGWYNGRNESDLHEALAVSRRVCAVNDFIFRTLLVPVKKGAPRPVVIEENDGFSVTVNGRTYHIDDV